MANREQIELEKEYQEALGVSKSMISDIQSILTSVSDTQEGVGDKTKDYLRSLSSSVDTLDNIEDISNVIADISNKQFDISKKYVGVNKELGGVLNSRLSVVSDLLDYEANTLTVMEQANKTSTKIANSFQSGVEALAQQVKQIPLIGKGLGWVADAAAEFTSTLTNEAVQRSMKDIRTQLDQGKPPLTAMQTKWTAIKSTVGSLIVSTKVLMATGVLLLLAGVAKLVSYFNEINESVVSFRKETGLILSTTGQLEGRFSQVLANTRNLGSSMEDISSAATSFTKEFDNLMIPSEYVLESMVKLNKQFGIALEPMAKVNRLFTDIGGNTTKVSQDMINTVVEASALVDVAPNQVIEDMAESAEDAFIFFGGSTSRLASEAVQAAKLGTSLKQSVDISRGLLDFESSITNELEASALLQTNLNFSQARQLAAAGKTVEAQQAILDEVERRVDLNNINIYQAEALAKATGLSTYEMRQQLSVRNRLAGADKETLAAAQEFIKSGGDITKLKRQELDTRLEQIRAERNLRTEYQQIKDELATIGKQLATELLPVAKGVLQFIKGIATFISHISKVVGGVVWLFKELESLFPNFKAFNSILEGWGLNFGKIAGYTAGIIGSLLLLGKGVKMLVALKTAIVGVGAAGATAAGGTAAIAGGLKTVSVAAIASVKGLAILAALVAVIGTSLWLAQDGIIAFGEAVLMVFQGIAGIVVPIVQTLVDGIVQIATVVSSMITDIFEVITPSKVASIFLLGPALMSAAAGFIAFASAVGVGGLLGGIGSGLGSLFGGESMLEKIEGLTELATPLTIVGTSLSMVATSIKQINDEIGKLNIEKLEKLENLGTFQTLALTAESIFNGGSSNEPNTIQGNVTTNNTEILNKLDELKQAYLQNKDVYMDKEKVTSVVKVQSEKSGMNLFGLGVA